MTGVRRVVLAVAVALSSTACTSVASDGVRAEIGTVAKELADTTGTAERLADAVRATEREQYLGLVVLSAEDLAPAPGEPTVRLDVAVHHEGYPDGFGDVSPLTRCYRLEFDADGLRGEPEEKVCAVDPWD